MSWINRRVENKFGGYKHTLNTVDDRLPEKISEVKNVCVIGAGLAGIASAYQLSKRGFHVDLIEKENFIGGKIGSWKYKEHYVEHGFHAFFKQYYNLRNFLKEIGSDKFLIPISDYEIRLKNNKKFSFSSIETTPIKNILSLREKGVYSILDMIMNPKHMKLIDLFKYDSEITFKKYDHVSFQEFADDIGLNKNMRLMFNTFARAFFAEPEDISVAELIKGFHFYFLSNNLGLVYDVLDDDFEFTLLSVIREKFEEYNVSLMLNEQIEKIEYQNDTFTIKEHEYDYVVMATESSATKRILGNSPDIVLASITGKHMDSSGDYAVLRLWIDKSIGEKDPFFIFVDRYKLLDSITFYHHMEKTSKELSEEKGIGVYELHAYSIPKKYEFTKEEVREVLIEEFYNYFPELKKAKIMDEFYQFRSDFTAFHQNNNNVRPTIESGHPNLYFAGDWVKMDNPSMLMEAAFTSGCIASNMICKKENIQEEVLYTVPKRGLFA